VSICRGIPRRQAICMTGDQYCATMRTYCYCYFIVILVPIDIVLVVILFPLLLLVLGIAFYGLDTHPVDDALVQSRSSMPQKDRERPQGASLPMGLGHFRGHPLRIPPGNVPNVVQREFFISPFCSYRASPSPPCLIRLGLDPCASCRFSSAPWDLYSARSTPRLGYPFSDTEFYRPPGPSSGCMLRWSLAASDCCSGGFAPLVTSPVLWPQSLDTPELHQPGCNITAMTT
jgi:hypothetical protein